MMPRIQKTQDAIGLNTLSIRVPADVMTEARKVKASMETRENRSVSMNELINIAIREFTKTAAV